MTKEEAISEIEDELADVERRAQGFDDHKGQLDLRAKAESIYAVARAVSDPTEYPRDRSGTAREAPSTLEGGHEPRDSVRRSDSNDTREGLSPRSRTSTNP